MDCHIGIGNFLPLTMLNIVISCFENVVDPSKLTLEKPDFDQDQQCF